MEAKMLDMAAKLESGVDDSAVRALLVSRAGEALRLAAWILHDQVAAEDAVQEASLLAWDRRLSLKSRESADAWFTRILVNVCLGELRRRSRRPKIVELEVDCEPGADDRHDELGLRDEIGAAIRRLDPSEQVLLALRYGRDLTVPQVAAVLGQPEGTVKSRLHYSLAPLRAALDAEARAEEAAR
jgi:RNA polymerase sigma-70 factor, ECF subfamily